MKYGQVEEAIIKIFKVQDARLGSFRARIRHLRQFDCPSIVKAKPGFPAEYSYLNAVQLAVALAVENVGVAPKFAAYLVINTITEEFLLAQGKIKEDRFLVVLHNVDPLDDYPKNEFSGVTYAWTFLHAHDLTKYSALYHALNLVNMSKIVRDLDAALATQE